MWQVDVIQHNITSMIISDSWKTIHHKTLLLTHNDR